MAGLCSLALSLSLLWFICAHTVVCLQLLTCSLQLHWLTVAIWTVATGIVLLRIESIEMIKVPLFQRVFILTGSPLPDSQFSVLRETSSTNNSLFCKKKKCFI